jgi:hypothetical protein
MYHRHELLDRILNQNVFGNSSALKQRASLSLRFQQKKKKKLPQTCLIGAIQKLGGLNIFAFPNQTELLSNVSSQNTSGTFDSFLMHNQLTVGIRPNYFWFITCLRCQVACYQSPAENSRKSRRWLHPVQTARMSLCRVLNVRTRLSP